MYEQLAHAKKVNHIEFFPHTQAVTKWADTALLPSEELKVKKIAANATSLPAFEEKNCLESGLGYTDYLKWPHIQNLSIFPLVFKTLCVTSF